MTESERNSENSSDSSSQSSSSSDSESETSSYEKSIPEKPNQGDEEINEAASKPNIETVSMHSQNNIVSGIMNTLGIASSDDEEEKQSNKFLSRTSSVSSSSSSSSSEDLTDDEEASGSPAVLADVTSDTNNSILQESSGHEIGNKDLSQSSSTNQINANSHEDENITLRIASQVSNKSPLLTFSDQTSSDSKHSDSDSESSSSSSDSENETDAKSNSNLQQEPVAEASTEETKRKPSTTSLDQASSHSSTSSSESSDDESSQSKRSETQQIKKTKSSSREASSVSSLSSDDRSQKRKTFSSRRSSVSSSSDESGNDSETEKSSKISSSSASNSRRSSRQSVKLVRSKAASPSSPRSNRENATKQQAPSPTTNRQRKPWTSPGYSRGFHAQISNMSYYHREYIRLKRSMDELARKNHKNRPTVTPFKPYSWNNLSPYYDTEHLRYILHTPIPGDRGYATRATASCLVDPEVSWQMDNCVEARPTTRPQLYRRHHKRRRSKTGDRSPKRNDVVVTRFPVLAPASTYENSSKSQKRNMRKEQAHYKY